VARVLVVDDAAFMRKLVSDVLTNGGHEVVGEAGDGVEAVAQYQALKPEVTTLDITMPEKDGLTALKEIIAIDPGARVIMCSALGQESKVLESIKAGAKDFVVKPFQPDRVILARFACCGSGARLWRAFVLVGSAGRDLRLGGDGGRAGRPGWSRLTALLRAKRLHPAAVGQCCSTADRPHAFLQPVRRQRPGNAVITPPGGFFAPQSPLDVRSETQRAAPSREAALCWTHVLSSPATTTRTFRQVKQAISRSGAVAAASAGARRVGARWVTRPDPPVRITS
jgi:two-component system chemotaxis response regulator CheY